MQLQGTTTLVTGGGRGIGRHAAIALGRAGGRVCVTARSGDELEATVDLVREAGGPDPVAVVGDVSSPEDVPRTVQEVGRRTACPRRRCSG